MKWWTDRMKLNKPRPPASGLERTLDSTVKLIDCLHFLDDSFENLLSVMVGSYYVTMHNNPSDVVKTRDMILGVPALIVMFAQV